MSFGLGENGAAACPGTGSRLTVVVVLLVVVLLAGLAQLLQAEEEPDAGRRLSILIDGVHAHNYLDRSLDPGNRDYHSLFGSADAFAYLRAQGGKISMLSEGRLNSAKLANFDTLFINLVSDNLPPFFVEEIFAIKDFVEAGGNLLIITDHSNAYHHSYKLMPLFEYLGIALYTESALDTPPNTLGSGPGWILINNFREHPVTLSLSAISFHSGGTVDSNGAVAFLSDSGWGDQWNTAAYGENSLVDGNRGNYGNFRLDEGERTGALAVVLARRMGLGKVVVVGDQNALGNLWLRFGDNYKLLLNIYAWFANQATPVDYASFIASDRPRVLLLDDLANSRFADYDPEGFYNIYTVLSRYYDTYIHNRIEYPYDLLVISPSVKRLSASQADAIADHLRLGKNVLVLDAKTGRPLLEEVASIGGVSSRAKNGDSGSQNINRSGARLLYQYDADRFINRYVAEPTQQPSARQKAVELAFLKRINSLLPINP